MSTSGYNVPTEALVIGVAALAGLAIALAIRGEGAPPAIIRLTSVGYPIFSAKRHVASSIQQVAPRVRRLRVMRSIDV